jgi:lipoprotein-anchoring transpeptidase ErfK/SrfK
MNCRYSIALMSLAAIALFICSCEPIPPQTQMRMPMPFPIPAPTPAGWWNDEGAKGSPRIVVHLSEQMAYFYKGKHLVGESTVSTGKRGFGTPAGHYEIISKDKDHYSSEFGDYVDDYGNIVKENIDVRKDRKPRGTHFDPAKMPYCMHFNGGYAMHEGYVPPFAASHGCIRLPKGMAEHFYRAAPEGTPVIVKE